jgi:hypothetical protein
MQLNIFSCVKISYTFFRHLEPQILSLMNTKKTKREKKRIISLLPFQYGFCNLQELYIVYYLIKCII